MRFGVREICEVVFRAKATQKLGSRTFYKNEPVLYFDTLKTSSLEGAATTVYATGGRGNTRLVAWEGERTLTFTFEDALISPESFSILSGAGLLPVDKDNPIYVHTTSQVEVQEKNLITLPEVPCWNKGYSREDPMFHTGADIFVMTMTNGQIDNEPCIPVEIVNDEDHTDGKTIRCYGHAGGIDRGDIVLVDYYVKRTGGAQLIEITPDKFGGNYYVEASTLFRDEATGVDMPAEFIIPNTKVQSNFTFTMAATGDPSTFTFTMDAFPDYTKFDRTHKVLAALQVITEAAESIDEEREPCRPTIIEGYEGSGLEVNYANDGTEALVKVTVSGNNINGGVNDPDIKFYDTATFGESLTEQAVELDIKFDDSLLTDDKYFVVQENPSLSKFYPGDMSDNKKSKEYDKKTLQDEPYQILLGDNAGNISVTLKKSDNGKEGEVIQVINITNKVSFIPKKNTTSTASFSNKV